MSVIEPLLLSTVHICTYAGPRLLTNASGFFSRVASAYSW